MKTWRYVATKVGDLGAGTESWEIRELYPEDDDTFSYTSGPVSPSGHDRDELIRDISRMAADVSLPWLDLTGETPRLVKSGLASTATTSPVHLQ